MAEDLSTYLSKQQCYCLNQSTSHQFANLFMGDDTLFLQSDVDRKLNTISIKHFDVMIHVAQLLITFIFRTTCKIQYLTIRAPENGNF